MGRQLQSKPLSKTTINGILSHNPSASKTTTPPVLPAIQPVVQQLITLKRTEEFDSLKPEEALKTFLTFARNVISRYEDNQKLQSDLEAETQDLLHYVELSDDMNACKGNDMYRKMREVRRKRRACKNEIDLLKPLYDYLSDKKMINELSQIQGKCRTAKEVICQRQYTLRTDVMK